MKFLRSPRFLTATPIATTLLLEYGNIGQLWRMWTDRTAAGQELTSWLAVWMALLLWLNFYRAHQLRGAFWATCAGVTLNTAVWLTVLYFRATGRG